MRPAGSTMQMLRVRRPGSKGGTYLDLQYGSITADGLKLLIYSTASTLHALAWY